MLAAIIYLVLWLVWGVAGGVLGYRNTDRLAGLGAWLIPWVLAGMVGWHLYGAALNR